METKLGGNGIGMIKDLDELAIESLEEFSVGVTRIIVEYHRIFNPKWAYFRINHESRKLEFYISQEMRELVKQDIKILELKSEFE